MVEHMRSTTGNLTAYQRSEIKRLEADGWTFHGVTRYQDDDNPWATIDISKGNYRTKAGLPTSRAMEAFLTGD